MRNWSKLKVKIPSGMVVKCVYTVYNVYAVYTVYTVYTVCIVTLLPPHTVYTICTIWTALYCSNTSMNADIYIVIKLKGYWMLEYGFKGFGGRNGMEWMGQWIRKIASLLTTWEPGVLKTSTCCYHCLMSDWCPLFVANIFRQGHSIKAWIWFSNILHHSVQEPRKTMLSARLDSWR